MADFATPTDLGNYMQLPIASNDPTAQLLLDLASDQIRDYLKQQVDYVANDVVTLNPVTPAAQAMANYMVLLPEQPVLSVSKVEYTYDGGVTWTTATPDTFGTPGDYNVYLDEGIVESTTFPSFWWPSQPGSWRVTYTHGYQVIPNTIRRVCLETAGSSYIMPVGIDSERIGQRQVKYSPRALSDIEMKALDRYRFPGIT